MSALFEHKAPIERGDGLPQPLMERRLDLWTFGQLAAEIDQASEGPNQISRVSALGLSHHPRLIILADGPAVGRRALRAQGAATVWSRSVKMRRPQARFAQHHWRTRHGKHTRYAAHGRSASVQVSRRWMRAAGTAQTGQGTMVWVEVTETVRRDAAVSRHHASRWSEVVSGHTRAKNAVPSMQVRGEKVAILS
jgi:hypothetical protein